MQAAGGELITSTFTSNLHARHFSNRDLISTAHVSFINILLFRNLQFTKTSRSHVRRWIHVNITAVWLFKGHIHRGALGLIIYTDDDGDDYDSLNKNDDDDDDDDDDDNDDDSLN